MIPIRYNAGSLRSRRMSTLLTILGIGVVIAVTLAMMALYNGVRSTVGATGSADLLKIMEDGVDAELSSGLTREQVAIIGALPGVAKTSPESVILFKLPKKDTGRRVNVTVRGVTPAAFELRPYVRIVSGRMFRPGVNEMIVARRIADRFANVSPGDSFNFGPQTWNVVGTFDAAGTAFDSEVWTDGDFLRAARKRDSFSSVLVKPIDRAALTSIEAAVQNDNRLKLQVRSEAEYYAHQTNGLTGIRKLVALVTFFMLGAAVFATMNTMFSAVASRSSELSTLRVLGFRRRSIVLSMLLESAAVALLGCVAGILLALPVNAISSGTMNPQTMSEVAFNFRVDRGVALIGVVIALGAGIAGGVMPAIRAATMPITRALREG